MERFVFVPSVAGTEWLSDLFPAWSLAELPVAGRRLVDYELEIAHKAGATLVDILYWRFSARLVDYFNSPTRTGSAVFYDKGIGELPRGLDDLAKQSSPLTQTLLEGLVVAWGPCLAMDFDDCETERLSPEECANTPHGIYRRTADGWERMKKVPLRIVNSHKAWHQMNFEVLHSPEEFTLPGYSSEKGVHLGRSVVIEHDTEIKAPVLLNDNTWFARNVRLDGDVIVGSGSFVSEGVRLKRTIVGNDTFIGKYLYLDNKIVIGRRVIDAETGAWMDIDEPGVARKIGHVRGIFGMIWRFLRGRSYGRRA